VFESMRLKILDILLVCGNCGGECAIYHGFRVYVIAIVFLDNKHVLVAGCAGCDKSASGVGVNQARGVIAVRVQVSCATGRWLGRGCVKLGVVTSGLLLCVVLVGCDRRWMRRTGLCCERFHSDLIQVALANGHRGWWVFSYCC
jgi:hypothetical protein